MIIVGSIYIYNNNLSTQKSYPFPSFPGCRSKVLVKPYFKPLHDRLGLLPKFQKHYLDIN